MGDDKTAKNKCPAIVKAPTYNELVTLVERLTVQLKAADGSAAVLVELEKLKSSITAKVKCDRTPPQRRETLDLFFLILFSRNSVVYTCL